MPLSEEEDEEEEDKIWGKDMGLHFTFPPAFFKKLADEGMDHQGEYGAYKILGPEGTAGEYSAAVGLVSDEMVVVGIAASYELDGIYHVYYYQFHLDIPWKMKGEAKTYRLFYRKSYDYVNTKMFDTKQRGRVRGLMQKCVNKIIELTEQELAARLSELS